MISPDIKCSRTGTRSNSLISGHYGIPARDFGPQNRLPDTMVGRESELEGQGFVGQSCVECLEALNLVFMQNTLQDSD